jgi:hypothetical protein
VAGAVQSAEAMIRFAEEGAEGAGCALGLWHGRPSQAKGRQGGKGGKTDGKHPKNSAAAAHMRQKGDGSSSGQRKQGGRRGEESIRAAVWGR